MSDKVVLILGAGANVGLATARKFTDAGWKVAAAARTIREQYNDAAALTIKADFSDPSSIASIFEKTRAELGTPSTVIYNTYGLTTNDAQNPFSTPLLPFISDTNTNLYSAYAAAQAAVAGFETLPDSVQKTFIYTGNALNHKVWVKAVSLGVGKVGFAHLMEAADIAFKGRYRFYWVDERTENGGPALKGADGLAHAEAFFELVQEQGFERGWEVNFVAGQGLKFFGRDLGGFKFP